MRQVSRDALTVQHKREYGENGGSNAFHLKEKVKGRDLRRSAAFSATSRGNFICSSKPSSHALCQSLPTTWTAVGHHGWLNQHPSPPMNANLMEALSKRHLLCFDISISEPLSDT